MTNTPTQAEIELRRKIYANVATATRSENSSLGSMTVDEATDQIMSLIQTYTQVVEKAYGGCRNCYGKGYATVNDRWIGHDTDTDIGSPGGTITGGNPNAMKFCSCERGKQLEKQFQAAEVQARVDELKLSFGTRESIVYINSEVVCENGHVSARKHWEKDDESNFTKWDKDELTKYAKENPLCSKCGTKVRYIESEEITYFYTPIGSEEIEERLAALQSPNTRAGGGEK